MIRRKFATLTALIFVATILLPGLSKAATGGYPNSSAQKVDWNTYGKYSWWIDENADGDVQAEDEFISGRGYYYRNCTDYVAWKLESLGVSTALTRGNGNGGQWDDSNPARSDSSPEPGDAAVFDNLAPPWGHVAFVESVKTNGTITISQYNRNGDGNYTTQTGTPAALGVTAFVDFGVKNVGAAKLTVKKTGSGTITSVPDGINCSSSCTADSATFLTTDTVTLTATPSSTWLFKGWSGDCSGTSTCKVKMTSSRNVTATFAPDPMLSGGFRGDFNGDGKDDVAAFYNYGSSRTKLWIFTANDDGAFDHPTLGWDSGPGNWNWNNIKQVAGDFNGDGKDDVAAFYNYGSSRTKLWIFTANDDGAFDHPTLGWDSGPGNWNWNNIKQVAGDFNGDGKDDVAAFYNYGSSRTKLWIFTANDDGAFDHPTLGWDSGPGNWNWNNIKQVAGDFNGDGKDDVAAFYNYGSSRTKLWIFTANDDGAFDHPTLGWDSGPGNWNWNNIKQVAGDFNGDGKDDVAAFYNYGSSRTKLWIFTANDDGAFDHPTLGWDSGPGNWNWNNIKQVAGDFNGDGKDDVAAFYNYGSSRTKLWIFTANDDGAFDHPTLGWDSGPGNWNWDKIKQV